MAKKVYKHNDYYGYINKIQEKAVSNPDWFWSDAEDASKARQWLHDNNAGAIVDEIYDNTPDDIKKKISYKKLTSDKAQETYNKGVTDATNKAAKYVAGTLAASAALPFAIECAIAAAPVVIPHLQAGVHALKVTPGATIAKGAADLIGGIAGGESARYVSNKTSEAITGKSLDYNIGHGLRKLVTSDPKNAVVADSKEREKKDENLGGWFNPITFIGGGYGAKYAKQGLINTADKVIIKRAFKNGRLEIVGPQQYKGVHHSKEAIYEPKFPFNERWDVVNHGADPNGMFFNLDTPVESGFLNKRKYKSNWTIDSNSSLIQHGEINGFGGGKNSMRNKIIKIGRGKGVDTFVFKNIADNTLPNQNIVFATDKAKFTLDNHNYYDRFKKISEDKVSKLAAGDDSALKALRAKLKDHKNFGDFVKKAVDENGNVDIERFDRVNEELYKMFDAAGIPYNRIENIGNKRTFNGTKVFKNGTLKDHALSVAESGRINPLMYDPSGTATKQNVVLGDLFHDHGIMVTKDQMLGQQYHELFGKQLGSILGLDRKTINAIGSHMGKPAKQPIARMMQAHDKLAGASIETAREAWRNGKQKIFSGRSLAPEWWNYKTEPTINFTLDSAKESIPIVERAMTRTSDGLNSMRNNLTKNSAFAAYVQSKDFADKNITKVLEQLKDQDPVAYKEAIEQIRDNIFGSASNSSLKDRIKLAIAKSHFDKEGPLIGGKLYQNSDDYINAVWRDTFGYDPNPIYRWGSEEEANKGFKDYILSVKPENENKAIFFGAENPSSGEIYSIKRKSATSKNATYIKSLTSKRYPLILEKGVKEKAQKNVLDYLKAFETLQSSLKNGSTDRKAIQTLLSAQSKVEDPMYLAQVFNATVKGTGPAANIEVDPFIRKGIDDLSKYYTDKVNGVASGLFQTNGMRLIPYYKPKKVTVVNIPSMPDFGINYWKDPKAVKYISAKLEEMYPGKFKYTQEWLSKSPRVTTDGLYAAMRKDQPNLITRGFINDFGGFMNNGQFPVEFMASANSGLINGLTTDPLNARIGEVANIIFKRKDDVLNVVKQTSKKVSNAGPILKHPEGFVLSNIINDD